MKIISYRPELAELTAASYARTFVEGGVPFCYPVSTEVLADPTRLPCDNLAQMHDDLVLVARQGDHIVGYVHAAVEERKPEEQRDWDDYAEPQGVLRMFWYERGQRAAGEALLVRAEDHLRTLGLSRIEVMHSKRRYLWHHLPHVHLSQRVEQVHGLLYARGYRRDKSNVGLAWPDAAEAPLAACDVAYTLRREEEACPGDIPRVLLWAMQGDTFCGMCVGASLGEQHADPRALEWVYIRWLTVSEPFRRHGLAQRLLTEMFQEFEPLGARHAAICCIEENAPALLLYANTGFRAADFTYTYVKELG